MTQFYGGKDFIYGTLAADCDTDDTELTLESFGQASALGAYSEGAIISIGTECMLCTNHAGAAITVSRGFGGTTPAIHYTGDVVKLANAWGYIEQLQDKLDAIELVLHATRGRTDGCVRKSGLTSGADPLFVSEQASPNLTIKVIDGYGMIAGDIQNGVSASIAIPAPVTHPRIDLIQLTLNTGVNRKAGSEAASPSAPSVDANSITLGTVHCRVGMTTVKNIDDSTNGYITDTRVWV